MANIEDIDNKERWDFYAFKHTKVRKNGVLYSKMAVSKTPKLFSDYHTVLLIDDDGNIATCPDKCEALNIGNLTKFCLSNAGDNHT